MTKVVQLSDSAYAHLRSLKRTGESFSDVVLRLTRRGDLSGLRGLRTRREVDAARRALAAIDRLDRG